MCSASKYGIEAARELAIVIADQKTNRFRPFGNVQATCRACCATHSAWGSAVHPARLLLYYGKAAILYRSI
jgi:hypothetical protein